MALEIGLLGTVEAHRDGSPLTLGGARQSRLIAHLALTPGRVRSLDGIVAAVWPDGDEPPEPRRAIRTYASRLRGLVGTDVIVARDGGYALLVGPPDVDVCRFERLIQQAGDPGCPREHSVALLSEALDQWRGPALEGFESEQWARADAVRLDELRARAVDDRAEALLALDRAGEAVADLEAGAAKSPLRERTHALLMTALHRGGRQAEALRVYEQYRARLATELGLEPGPELRRVEAEVAAGLPMESRTDQARPLRGYVLGERIGDGSFAVVYRGTQPALDRDVAIKVIRAELANRPEFIRRFEFEAHVIARLEHPHIVPLYDYWREPGGAYLVMRLLRGGTLERAVMDRRLNLDAVVRLAEQVGGALATAHRAGIVHRDVKPANVFIDGEDNFFLGDFGIALEAAAPVHPTDTLSIGSPAYASPEQLRRQPAGPAADVHGLAITLFEALTGQLPFPQARTQAELLRHQLTESLPAITGLRPDLPAGLDAVIARATAKNPGDRHSSVREFVATFVEAARGTVVPSRVGTPTVVGEFRNPYKGLRAFQEADAGDFYGRQRLVDKLIARLAGSQPASRILTVVGPSGSGKSSVVRAGVIPALRSGALAGSSEWFITSMVPGSHPFEELESALNRIATVRTAGLADLMASGPRGIARAINHACPVEGGEVVLMIDQFEELFTLGNDEVLRHRFISGLVDAVCDARSRLHVIATLRADFYDRPLRYPELAPLIEEGVVTVSPLAPDELERAITEPAARVGAAFEPGVVAQIVADVLDQPGALPLLQYTLTEMFDQNVSGLMTLATYEELGGLSGTLARRAEQVFAGSSVGEQGAARRMFSRLVNLGEGTQDTRRRVRRSEFAGGAEDGSDAARVIDAYGAARLLAFDRDPITREPTVEVAHEALIREWPRLRSWLDDDRDGLRIHRQLTDAAASWEVSGRDASELFHGARLDVTEAFAAGHPSDLNPHEAAFLAASNEQREVARRAEVRSRRRIKCALIAVAVVAIAALVAGMVAFQQRRNASDAATEAKAERDQARVDRLVAESGRELDSHFDLALLLAVEAHRRQDSPETRGALLTALTHHLTAGTTAITGPGSPQPTTSAFLGSLPSPPRLQLDVDSSPDGAIVASSGLAGPSGADGVVTIYDLMGSREIVAVSGQTAFFNVDVSDDGRDVVANTSFEVRLIDVETGTDKVLPVPPPEAVTIADVEAGKTAIATAQFRPGTHDVLVVDSDGLMTMWDGPTGTMLPATLPTGPTGLVDFRRAAATGLVGFRADGTLRVVTSGPEGLTVEYWDVELGESRRRLVLEDPEARLWQVAESPDGTMLAGQESQGRVFLWDLGSGSLVGDPSDRPTSTRGLSFQPDQPNVLAIGLTAGGIALHDVARDRPIGSTLIGHESGLFSVAHSRDGRYLFGVGGGPVDVWEDSRLGGLIGSRLAADAKEPESSTDGSRVLVRVGDALEVRAGSDLAAPGVRIESPGDVAFAFGEQSYDISDDGRRVAVLAGSEPMTILVADAQTGAPVWTSTDATFNPTGASLSPDGSLVVAIDFDANTMRLWSVPSAALLGEVAISDIDATPGTFFTGRPQFGPDGRYVDVATTTGIARLSGLDLSLVIHAPSPFVPQGDLDDVPGTDDVIAGGSGGQIGRWNMSTGELERTGRSRDSSTLFNVATSPDGSLVVASHPFSGKLALFDAATLRPVGEPFRVGGPLATPQFIAAGVMGDDLFGALSLWTVDAQEWQDVACRAAGRTLTEEEWARYLGDQVPYEPPC